MRSGLLIAGSLVVLVAADAVALTPFADVGSTDGNEVKVLERRAPKLRG